MLLTGANCAFAATSITTPGSIIMALLKQRIILYICRLFRTLLRGNSFALRLIVLRVGSCLIVINNFGNYNNPGPSSGLQLILQVQQHLLTMVKRHHDTKLVRLA